MIRDRYGTIWAGREDLATDWGQEAADTTWSDLLDTYHPTRTLVEEGGHPPPRPRRYSSRMGRPHPPGDVGTTGA